MPVDPFRIQILTLALDSQVVLTVVGLVVAGLAFRLAARQAGLPDEEAGSWWDVAFAAVVGGRVAWVALHLAYYVRGPLQALVLTDGGLHPVGLVLGAGYAIWRLARRQPGRQMWRTGLECVALATLVVFLFERAGCALTTCGGGLPTDAPWALRRGDDLREPVALAQAAVLAGALVLATEVPRLAGRTLIVALAALALVEVVGIAWADQGSDGLAAVLLAGVLAAVARVLTGRRNTPRLATRLAVAESEAPPG